MEDLLGRRRAEELRWLDGYVAMTELVGDDERRQGLLRTDEPVAEVVVRLRTRRGTGRCRLNVLLDHVDAKQLGGNDELAARLEVERRFLLGEQVDLVGFWGREILDGVTLEVIEVWDELRAGVRGREEHEGRRRVKE
jgi:hypothetical protein